MPAASGDGETGGAGGTSRPPGSPGPVAGGTFTRGEGARTCELSWRHGDLFNPSLVGKTVAERLDLLATDVRVHDDRIGCV